MEHASNYYEGILQLRNPNQEVIEAIKKMISKRKGVFIAKEVKSVNGMDLYLSSQKFLQIIGKRLQRSFGGEMKISRKLFTVKRLTSKKVYRVTVLFRLPKFKKGDVITVRGRQIKILKLGKKVFGKYLDTNKKVLMAYDKFN